MKKMLVLLILMLNTLVFCQSLTQAEKQEIINNLDSTKHWVREKAILDILEFNITEALPTLEQNIFTQEQDIASLYLKGLFQFNSTLSVSYAKKFIDTVGYLNGFPGSLYQSQDSFNVKYLKYEAASILFQKGDFSKAGIIISWIDFRYPKITALMPDQLSLILDIPQYELKAKNELIRISNSPSAEDYSAKAVKYLVNHFGNNIIPELLEIYSSNNYYVTRRYILGYLDNLNYPDYENFLKEHFSSDTSLTDIIIEKLLIRYPTPENYIFINNKLTGLSEVNKEYYSIILEDYEPTPPDELSSLFEDIQYLNTLCDSLLMYDWLADVQFKDLLQSIVQYSENDLLNNDSLACRAEIKSFQDTVDFVYADSLNPDPRFVTLEGWKFLHWNAQYILDRLPEPQQNPNLLVNLQNSGGTQIPASNVKYYDTSWKDAVDNGDGTFAVITTKPNVSVRVFYEYANQTVNNIPAQNNTYTFYTVNTQVELKNSTGQLMDEGTVKYYAGAWRDFGTTVNGVASKELLPVNYSFRMTYEYGSNDKQQDISSNATVIFQTVNASVQLQNSTGSLIDQGTVQYYAGAWRSFGTTINGAAHKELLPNNYSFRMTYEYVSTDKQQDLNTNPTVTFSTVLCTVQVKDQQNQPVNNADVKYYSGAWREIGLTNSNGEITKELLPANLSFRAALGTVHQDVQQDLSVNNIVQIVLSLQ